MIAIVRCPSVKDKWLIENNVWAEVTNSLWDHERTIHLYEPGLDAILYKAFLESPRPRVQHYPAFCIIHKELHTNGSRLEQFKAMLDTVK